jgi:hypothetical protein
MSYTVYTAVTHTYYPHGLLTCIVNKNGFFSNKKYRQFLPLKGDKNNIGKCLIMSKNSGFEGHSEEGISIALTSTSLETWIFWNKYFTCTKYF